jgi:hypothetical protein
MAADGSVALEHVWRSPCDLPDYGRSLFVSAARPMAWAGAAKLVGEVAAAVVGEQSADGDAMASEDVRAFCRKAMVLEVF